ncbi:MAG: putative DNA binding domain-containing protein [Actinomycetota bacterium]|nr:putative DNA binding domain-containing protein [Actinomycetota bacterium]
MIGPLARDDLATLVASGEDSFVEFKDPRVSNADLAKELCAFANSQGGRVLVGIDDDGGILDAAGLEEERVMNIVRTSIDPPLVPTYQRVPWDDVRTVVVVGVEPGAEKPYAVRSGESRRYFVRVGSTKREASREELVRLTQASGAVASDLRPVVGATLEDLDDALLSRRFAGRRSMSFEELGADQRRQVLVAADILEAETGRPTIGGLLCYGRQPQDRLPYAMVTCAAYPGAAVGRELLDRFEASGRVEEQIEQAASFVERNLRAPSTVEGLTRHEEARHPLESFREAVANAVAHRHYGIAGPSHVRMFTDRVEVVSPGAPPNGVSPESMRVGVSVRRNEFILARLAELGVVDAVGRGVVLLYEEAAARGLPEPEIAVEENWTRLVLWHRSP